MARTARLVVFLCMAVGFLSAAAHAMDLYSYDLDSLVYMSDEVVEGRLGASYKLPGGLDVTDLKVATVFKGSFATSETVKLTSLESYRKLKPGDRTEGTVPLAQGDRLILFLAKARETMLYHVPADTTVYWPAPSGVKVISEGKVLGFSQRGNPGPYVLQTEAEYAAEPADVNEFLRELPETVTRMKALALRFGAASTEEDAPWLLQTLRERAKSPRPRNFFFARDHIGEVANARLANLHDPQALDEVLGLSRTWSETKLLDAGFSTPAGRDYLLSAIRDANRPVESRLRLARTLQAAGPVYGRSAVDIQTTSTRTVGEVGTRNNDYITRIARLAAEGAQDEKLAIALASTIGQFARNVAHEEGENCYEDLLAALSVLRRAYDGSKSERLRYEIELATAHGGSALYDELGSSCGPVVSILAPLDPAKHYAPPQAGEIGFEYSYESLSKDEFTTEIVFQSEESGQKYRVPSKSPLHPGAGGGSEIAVVPEGLPHGKYRVYYQLKQSDRVVSVGHYFVADL